MTQGLGPGSYAILSTPFTEKQDIDISSLRSIVRFYAERGAAGLVTLAVMGEGSKVLPEERANIIREVTASAGELPVIVGVSGPGTRLVQDRAQEALDLGASGILVAPAGTLSADEHIRFYEEVGSVGLPIFLQDHPASTGITMSEGVIAEVVKRVDNVVGIKMEAPPTDEKIRVIRRLLGQKPCLIVGGLGGLHLIEELNAGSDGTMTGFAFPEVLSAVVNLYRDANKQSAERLYQRFLPLLVHESTQKLSLSIRKEFLRLRGVISTNTLRSPAAVLDATVLERTKDLYEQFHSALGEL